MFFLQMEYKLLSESRKLNKRGALIKLKKKKKSAGGDAY